MFDVFRYRMAVLILLVCSICYGADLRESVCLNGKWQFKLTEPKEQESFSDIIVPGHWELQGFGRPQWAWPEEKAGVYKKEIAIPKSWEGKRYYLNFGGVYYRSKTYLNGQLLGDHENGYNEFEYDITDVVGAGEKAELRVEICTYGDYIEFDNLDFWALPGIFRDVNLFARPAVHIASWKYSTKWSDARADVTVSGKLNDAADGMAVVKLKYKGKKVVEKRIAVRQGTFEGMVEVDEPKGWSAETPNLYYMEVSLEQDGEKVDMVGSRVGLREIKAVGPDLLVNGRAIKIMGVARHDSWADYGRILPEKISRFDIELMKKTGVNAVRTAHHTPEKAFLRLADELGLYVLDNIAMSNVEKHIDKPEFVPGTILRTKETVARDILHPSVICWVMGNENRMGLLHEIMYKEIRKLDTSRPSLMPAYIGNKEFPELNSIHYPSGRNLLENLSNFPDRPLICTEYQHSAFDGIGGLEELWDVFDISPAGCGGTIWEWFDQGLEHDWHLTWQNYWPEIFSVWPAAVTLNVGDDTAKMPCGFSPGLSCAPITLFIEWDGDGGDYKLNFYILNDEETDRVEVSYDGIFAGVYHTKPGASEVSYPVKLLYDGRHKVTMKWDYVGGGHDFDCIELIDDKGELAWRIGKKDGSSGEFAVKPTGERMEKSRVDTVMNEGTDGMLGPRREKQDEYYNVRAVYAPVQIEQKSVDMINKKWTVDVENRYSFTELDHESEFLVQYYDGKRIREKRFKGPELKMKPLSKKKVVLDLSFLKNNSAAAVCWRVPSTEKLCPDMLGQIWLNLSDAAVLKKMPEAEIEIKEENGNLVVNAGKAEILFDKKEGGLKSYKIGGDILIEDTVGVSIWKPMLEHEQNFLYPLSYKDKWGRGRKSFLNREPEGDFIRKNRTMQYERVGDRFVVTFINQYLLSSNRKEMMRGYEAYEIDKRGTVMLKCCWWWQGADSQLRRLGFDFVLPEKFERITFSGEGPWACYGDAKAGTNDCIHQLDRDDKRLATNKTDCRWLKWSGGGRALTLKADWQADIQASVNPGVTIQRVSRTRGCGNKYILPANQNWVWFFHNQVIQMAVEIAGE